MSEYRRLTRKDDKDRWVAEAGHYGIYLDNVLPKRKNMIYGDLVDRLAELENKIESGELVELPKKVFLGNDKFAGAEYVVITAKCYLFDDGQEADDFLEKEKARLRGRTSDEQLCPI